MPKEYRKRYTGNEKTNAKNPYASKVKYTERNFTEITEISIESPRTGTWFTIPQDKFHLLDEGTRTKIIRACQRHERKCIQRCSEISSEMDTGDNPYRWKENNPLVVALTSDDFVHINAAWVAMANENP